MKNALARLLAPLSVDQFLADYFARQPLFLKGFAGKFDFLMRPQDFALGLNEVDEIRCVFDRLKQATIAAADLKQMYDAGATICVTGIDKAHASLTQACQSIRAEINYSGMIDCRAYLSPPGKGFDIHYDARVATSLQLSGTKTWWYSEAPHQSDPLDNSPTDNPKAVQRAVARHTLKKVTLHPGDLLCVPAGCWHQARAGRQGSLALNLAFNHQSGSVLNLVLEHLRQQGLGHPECRAALQPGRSLPQLRPTHRKQISACLDALLPGGLSAPERAQLASRILQDWQPPKPPQ